MSGSLAVMIAAVAGVRARPRIRGRAGARPLPPLPPTTVQLAVVLDGLEFPAQR